LIQTVCRGIGRVLARLAGVWLEAKELLGNPRPAKSKGQKQRNALLGSAPPGCCHPRPARNESDKATRQEQEVCGKRDSFVRPGGGDVRPCRAFFEKDVDKKWGGIKL
jgi:hypothetical protein